MHSALYTMHNAQCTMHIAQYTMHCPHIGLKWVTDRDGGLGNHGILNTDWFS